MAAYVGLLTIQLFIPLSHSLKEKRRVINRIKARVKNKFNVSISEIAALDKWQLAELGVAIIGNDHKMLEKSLQEVIKLIDSLMLGEGEILTKEITYL